MIIILIYCPIGFQRRTAPIITTNEHVVIETFQTCRQRGHELIFLQVVIRLFDRFVTFDGKSGAQLRGPGIAG